MIVSAKAMLLSYGEGIPQRVTSWGGLPVTKSL